MSVVYNCFCPSPAQLFLGPSPKGLMTTFSVSDSRLPQPGRPGPHIYIPQERGGPVIPPGTWFPFRPLYIALAQTAQKTSSIIACSLVAGETTCPQSCSLATGVILYCRQFTQLLLANGSTCQNIFRYLSSKDFSLFRQLNIHRLLNTVSQHIAKTVQ
jgi:hypothetical protein